MNILLTGANGFIGRYLLARLMAAGHDVVPAVRRPEETDRLLHRPASIRADFNRDTRVEDWLSRLHGIDCVINCAGILNGRPGQSIEAIHADAPMALFSACAAAGVRRVIQISAISAQADANTAYANTKMKADSFLGSTDLDWVILRPSLVYASGAYGGTALFRAFAALPFATPLVGKGEQQFQPIHIDDLANTVLKILDTPALRQITIDPVGPERLSLREILRDLRNWLGLVPIPTIEIPLPLIRIAARVGDVFGGPINTTALRQLEFGNTGSYEKFVEATGVHPLRWRDALTANPAQPQDRLHARLYFLRPLLRLSIAATWLISGIVGLLQEEYLEGRYSVFGTALSEIDIWAMCGVDLGIGFAVLTQWRTSLIAKVQLIIVAFYTAALTIAEPSLWTEPLGPLLKNIPFIIAILLLAAMESER